MYSAGRLGDDHRIPRPIPPCLGAGFMQSPGFNLVFPAVDGIDIQHFLLTSRFFLKGASRPKPPAGARKHYTQKYRFIQSKIRIKMFAIRAYYRMDDCLFAENVVILQANLGE
jgi:hypothetical protein